MTTIHFIRHGDVHNPEKVFYARLPRFRLSETGQQQVAAAADYLKDRPLAAVISSPRLRARQTAQAIAAPHDLAVQQSRLVDEILTPHEGRPIMELDAEGWILYENLPPGYETAPEVQDRAVRFIERLREAYPGQEVAVVTHGDIVLSARFWAENMPFTNSSKNRVKLYPATASITTLHFNNGEARPALRYIKPY